MTKRPIRDRSEKTTKPLADARLRQVQGGAGGNFGDTPGLNAGGNFGDTPGLN